MALEAIPRMHAKALYLHSIGFTVEEVAHMLNIPSGTLRGYLPRGRRELLAIG